MASIFRNASVGKRLSLGFKVLILVSLLCLLYFAAVFIWDAPIRGMLWIGALIGLVLISFIDVFLEKKYGSQYLRIREAFGKTLIAIIYAVLGVAVYLKALSDPKEAILFGCFIILVSFAGAWQQSARTKDANQVAVDQTD